MCNIIQGIKSVIMHDKQIYFTRRAEARSVITRRQIRRQTSERYELCYLSFFQVLYKVDKNICQPGSEVDQRHLVSFMPLVRFHDDVFTVSTCSS